MSRIKELRELDPSLGQATPGKSLPARPASEVDPNPQLSNEPPTSDDDEPIEIQTATVTRIANDKSVYNSTTSPPSNANNRPLETTRPTITRDSTLASAFKAVESALPIDNQTSFLLQSPITPGDNGSAKERIISMELPMMPMDKTYMPPPLSPRYPPSPKTASAEQPSSHLLQPPKQQQPQKHSREGSSGSVSWLDTIDESNSSSCRSSMHSTSSEGPMRRQAVKARPESNGTQAEFDAALDAAVEAAYDEGLEPDEEDRLVIHSGDAVRTALRNVELAKERVREAEREEAIQAAKLKDKERRLREGTKGSNGKLDLTFGRDELGRVREGSKRANGKLDLPLVRDDLGRGMGFGQTSPYGDDDDAEEERLLDEMTREYMLDGFDFGLQNKSALPRQSDGSEFSGSGSTWNSSRSSNRTTGTNAATAISALGTVAESEGFERPGLATSKSMGALPTVSETNGIKKTATPPPKPATSSSRPSTANGPPLKPPPAAPSASTLPRQQSQQSSVRSRRMSGQNAKQLKIETSLPSKSSLMNKKQPEPPLSSNSRTPPSVPPKSPPMATSMAGGIYQSSNISARPQLQKTKSLVEPFVPLPAHSPADTTITVSPATPGLTKVISNDGSLPPPSPGRVSSKPQRLELRKNKSSISLRNNRQLSVSSPDVSDGGSVGTPMSTTFSNFSAKTKGSTLVNSSTASQMTAVPGMPAGALPFAIEAGTPSGGMHLFESDIHSPSQPGSPNPLAFQPPAPLEPCPCSHLLRPFWLMRCLYQTMAHPRGGYLSTKLFVPREVWKVKGIKLKAVDEKIANCDLLTAALGKLARVDMIDADAVLEEMQSLEVVLDQVQTALSKKLGNDVGVSGLSSLFSQGPTQNGEGGAGANDTTGLRTSGGDKSKGYLASWRRLRSKNSAAGLTSLTTTGLSAKKDGPPSGSEEGKNAPTMATIPMTSLPNIRFAKRDVDKIDWNAVGGALSNYMSSLARLCDAVQVVGTSDRFIHSPKGKYVRNRLLTLQQIK